MMFPDITQDYPDGFSEGHFQGRAYCSSWTKQKATLLAWNWLDENSSLYPL